MHHQRVLACSLMSFEALPLASVAVMSGNCALVSRAGFECYKSGTLGQAGPVRSGRDEV